MLSSNSSSSIQKRRQTHRRQQSLEVPILATPLPANPRRQQQHGRLGHRRGLSLDQSLTALESPDAFRPRLPQDQGLTPPTGSPSVRIHLDTTNIGQPPEQHFVQVTQQHQPPQVAQPGYQHPPDFHSHLQQQLNGSHSPAADFKPVHAAPPQHHQQHALQELQNHLEWYRNTYGSSPSPNVPTPHPHVDMNQNISHIDMPGAAMQQMQMMSQQPMQTMPQTPVSQGHSHTVPNTPQSYTHGWPSPPPTNVKHARSQSFQLDVAPMPDSMSSQSMSASSFGQLNFNQLQNSFAADTPYASSAYSSSQVDPLSPGPIHPAGPMPTLFEEPTPPLNGPPQMGADPLLQATAGGPDFNDADFDFNVPIGLSPRQHMLNNLGPDLPASIVDTGVPAYEVARYMGELGPDNKYPCQYPECRRRFGRKENVRAHIQTHLGDRQFQCDLCHKTFVRQHDLKRHVAIHSDHRPFVCPCDASFARHDALTRHRQRGMCHGALPGFEKTEEEKPKRGRPKKERRPDLESRVEKSCKQRRKNASSASTSSASFPVTPPADTSSDDHVNVDVDAFLNLATTPPPTSSPLPASSDHDDGISPSALHTTSSSSSSFHGGSSPDFFGLDDTGAVYPDAIGGFDAFSPPGESNSSLSVDWDLPVHGGGDTSVFGEFLGGQHMLGEELGVGEKSLAESLDEWLGGH